MMYIYCICTSAYWYFANILLVQKCLIILERLRNRIKSKCNVMRLKILATTTVHFLRLAITQARRANSLMNRVCA